MTNMENEESRIDSQGTRACSSKKRGRLDKPPRIYWATGLNGLRISPPIKLQTANDSIVNNKRL